jgi:hypothetical protein
VKEGRKATLQIQFTSGTHRELEEGRGGKKEGRKAGRKMKRRKDEQKEERKMNETSFLPSFQFRDWIKSGFDAKEFAHYGWVRKEMCNNDSIFLTEMKDLMEVPSVLPSFFFSSIRRPFILPSFHPSDRPSVLPPYRASFLPSFLPFFLPSVLPSRPSFTSGSEKTEVKEGSEGRKRGKGALIPSAPSFLP